MRPPKPTTAELHLKRENDGLRTTVVRLRHDLTTNKQGHVDRLEVLLRERLNRIDELTATIDQLRAVNQKLGCRS